jgi:hypothetical protein
LKKLSKKIEGFGTHEEGIFRHKMCTSKLQAECAEPLIPPDYPLPLPDSLCTLPEVPKHSAVETLH